MVNKSEIKINLVDPNKLIELDDASGLQPLGGFLLNPADIEPGRQFHKQDSLEKPTLKPQPPIELVAS